MKKAGKLLILSFLMGLIILGMFSLVSAATNPWSASASGAQKNEFTNLQDIYIKSTSLCEPNTEVNLYVIEDKDSWDGGEVLIDIRNEGFQQIILDAGKISLTKIWENPFPGNYDLVVDCNENGEYDSFIDKVDDFSEIGFTVNAIVGKASATLGEKDVENHSWAYDPEDPNLLNVMMQLNLAIVGEDLELEDIVIQALGTGNSSEIRSIEIYFDENDNGLLEEEILITSIDSPFSEGDEATLDLDLIIIDREEANILITYVMKETTPEGEYSFNVKSVSGTGSVSQESVTFIGLPLRSKTKTVLSGKTCLGELTLELNPNPGIFNSEVTAKISGLMGCEGKQIILRENPCGSSLEEKIDSCIVPSGGTGCDISFSSKKEMTIQACIDKNNNNKLTDFGEFAFEDLLLENPPEPINEEPINETENETEINVTVGETDQNPGISGGVIEEIKESLSETNSFFILLEITLLLILFVLVLIMFKLKAPGPSLEEKKEEEKVEADIVKENVEAEEKPKKKRARRTRKPNKILC